MFCYKQKAFWFLYGIVLVTVTIVFAEASLRVAAQLSWRVDSLTRLMQDCFVHDAQGFFCAATHIAQIMTHAAIGTTTH